MIGANDRPGQRAWRTALVLLVALLALRVVMMVVAPLSDTTEARYAELARRMLATGDFVTPWFDTGVPFWGKPPLSFWLTAGSFQLFGINEFAARLPHLLCVVAVAAIVGWVGRDAARRRGWLAATLLAGSAGAFLAAGGVMTDPALLVGVTLMLAGFWRALQAENAAGRRLGNVCLFVALAIGLLAKGPVALALGGAPLAAWTLLRGRLRLVWERVAWIRGTLAVVVLTVPWYVLAELRTPGFLEYFLLGEHWHRFVTPGWTGDLYGFAHREPPGKIWLHALAIALPWPLILLLLPRSGRVGPAIGEGEGRDRTVYLLCWALWPLLFFTAARNIIWTYALPALPGLALLAADGLARCDPRIVWRRLCMSLLALLLVMGSAFAWQLGWIEAQSARLAVQAWQRDRAAAEPLVFVPSRPFSASFYGRGEPRAERDLAAAMAAMAPGRGYVGVAEGVPRDRIVEAATRGEAVALGRFGDVHLYRMVRPPAPPDEAASGAVPALPR